MADLNFLSIHEAAPLLHDGTLPPHSLTGACFRQIERLNPTLNAFITIQQPPVNGQLSAGKLAGIPIAVKDLFETAGIKTTAGSLFFKDYVPTEDAAAVQKIKSAGAIVMGKTNTHEIALGVTTVNPHYGITRNPWDITRIPGGSSGGSAVAVAAGMALAALGTDTGGSIRIPASLCGVVGFKPTFGRVSLRGIFPLSWNLDHAGPLTRSVKDAALLLQVMAGYDDKDAASINIPIDDYLLRIEEGVKDMRIVLAVGEYIEDSDTDILQAIHEAAKIFKKAGAMIEQVNMSFLRDAAFANGVMVQADGAAYHRERLSEAPENFGADVRQRLETGRNSTSTEYSLARHTQTEMKRRMENFFEQYDLLLLPSTPIAAPLIEGSDAVEQARKLTRFTAPFNLTGLPALSLPGGFSKDGLPIGLQIVSRAWNESSVLRAGLAYERETNWGARRPPIV
ncbi:MAG: Asp-tRNA(Asn)/Glu-tRNA(Gln) amidotransferase subunit GatA [Chloroflexi bacterium]|nr:Asp-tRNA(Asn)/Glu-tRNA(Gln) amidotransferase subunit GatA [Chloroflexota bacterium]MBI3340599.1 Asp-tRNA(Asn)/Glu-tRNA(Gln) amidotransferase subunit GatA [Chloroflexota bacterium]